MADFTRREVSALGQPKAVYVSGSGPAVVIMAEMPGMSPHVARFARWVRDAGFTVYMPSLFGRDGAVQSADEGAAVFRRACTSMEFRALGGGVASPVTNWLRALARVALDECGGAGVGAIGMCFTGNFALSMMLDHATIAPVLCQPSLPFDNPAGIEISAEEISTIRQRLDEENLDVMAYRFEGDHFCKAERFAAYREALGEHFIERVLPDSAAGQDVPPFFEKHVRSPHSVVTVHLIDEQGQPTLAARDEIIAFLTGRLKTK
ncbi:MAG: dienelactone hydrolase family protein [Mesorhizobium sp.]